MSQQLTNTQIAILNSQSPRLVAAGLDLGTKLDEVLQDLQAGGWAVEADAADIDSLAAGGGHFTWDQDSSAGLNFAYKAGRFHNGLAVVNVGASSITLSPSTTNYIEVDRAGTVSKNTSGFTSGRLPLFTVVTGTGSISTVTVKKPLMTLIGPAGVNAEMLSAAAATRAISLPVGTVSATRTVLIPLADIAGTLTRVSLASSASIAASDTDYWEVAIVNKGGDGSGTDDMLAATAANSTKSTGGSAIDAFQAWEATLHGTAGNLDAEARDVLALTLTKTGSADDLDDLTIVLEFLLTE